MRRGSDGAGALRAAGGGGGGSGGPGSLRSGGAATGGARSQGHLKALDVRPWSTYEWICYRTDVLVPEPQPDTIKVRPGQMLQQVKYSRSFWSYRLLPDPEARFPPVLKSRDQEELNVYHIIDEEKRWVPIFDYSSPFLKIWENIVFLAILYAVTVTPFETAWVGLLCGRAGA